MVNSPDMSNAEEGKTDELNQGGERPQLVIII